MDTVTHALVGAAISDGFFRARLGRWATPCALAAASLPDIDVVTYFVAPEYAWAYHRGYTHSLFPMLLAAPLLGWVCSRLAGDRGAWKTWSLLALLCLFAHTLIDLVTSWGTMPFLPFSNARISWDVAPILDVFVFSVAAASFAANRLLRRERKETFANPVSYPVVHRHPRRRRVAGWMGRVAMALVLVYLLVGWFQNRQVVAMATRELASQGVTAVEVRALPIMFTYLAWDIAARDASGTVHNAVYSVYAPRKPEFMAFRRQGGDALQRVLATPEGELFAWYTQDMYASRTESDAGGMRVILEDRRFFTLTHPEAPRFAMVFRLDERGGPRSVECLQMGFDGVDLSVEARALYELTRFGGVGSGSR